MKKTTLLLLLLFASTLIFGQKISLYNLTTEHKENPIGIGTSNPRLSWIIRSSGSNMIQTSYEFDVTHSK